MSLANPAQETSTETEDRSTARNESATRLNRFFAALIDGAIICACTLPIMFMLVFMGMTSGILSAIIGTVVGAAAFIGINYKLLDSKGQTVGKKLMNLQIVGRSDRMVPVQELLKRRYLPIFAVTAIPVLGGLIALANILLIFRDSQACGHDDLAETKVVQL